MGLKNGLYIFMIRQFFRNIPVDLEEAAYVDGCGMLRTFTRVMLPQTKPIVTSCFLFAFVWQWTDGFYSKMFLGNIKLVSTGLARLVDSLSAYIQRMTGVLTTVSIAYSNCILATGTLMIIMPLIILYLFAQRAFVESISTSGIKMKIYLVIPVREQTRQINIALKVLQERQNRRRVYYEAEDVHKSSVGDYGGCDGDERAGSHGRRGRLHGDYG